jgi:hypothetical protein
MLWCVFLVLVLALSCVSPPPPSPPPLPPEIITYYVEVPTEERQLYLQPLSAALLEELDRLGAVSNFQYYLSGPLVMISEGSEPMRGSNKHGTLEITTDFASDILIINANTLGEVLAVRRDGEGRIFLEMSFEPGATNRSLVFAEAGTDGYFYLQVDNGLTQYDNRQFLVHENTGSLPHLLIAVETSMFPITPRHLPGREIAENSSSSPADFPISGNLFRPGAPAQAQPLPPVPPPFEPAQPELRAEPPPTAPRPVEPGPPEARTQPKLLIVQVGAFLKQENAQAVYERLIAAGFNPAFERHRNFYRVIVPNVAPGDLPAVTQRLNRAGFSELWVR